MVIHSITYVKYFIIFVYRLVQSEDVQYFRFDENGDLFIYETGSGFSGPSFKVEQGFEINEVMQNYDMNVMKSELALNVTSTESNLLSQNCVESTDITKVAGAKRLYIYSFHSV